MQQAFEILSRKPTKSLTKAHKTGRRQQQQHLSGGGGHLSWVKNYYTSQYGSLLHPIIDKPYLPYHSRKSKRREKEPPFQVSSFTCQPSPHSILLMSSSALFAVLRLSVSVLAAALSGGGGGVCSPADPASSAPQSIPSSRKFREGGAAPGVLSLGDASPSRKRFLREGMGILFGSGEF